MSQRRKQFAKLLILTISSSVLGCTTVRPHSKSSSLHSPQHKAPIASSQIDEEALVRPAAFNQTDSDENGVVVPYVIEEGGVASSSSESNPAGMTLVEFESLALGNNPTIAELVATTQKAAGFRTQVGLRANPTLGYNATQLADAGTDQHTAFISQTIVTADKLALNRRVLNEALRSQLMQLEAQKYRVATDIRVKFYDALAAQRRIELIRDFQSVSDKGVELAELRKTAMEGSQLDVVQAIVQQNEIDLALQQAEVSYIASWRELAAFAGTPQMTPVALQGELPQAENTIDWERLASTMVVSSPEYRTAQARVSQAAANINRQNVQAIPNLDVNLAQLPQQLQRGAVNHWIFVILFPLHFSFTNFCR